MSPQLLVISFQKTLWSSAYVQIKAEFSLLYDSQIQDK